MGNYVDGHNESLEEKQQPVLVFHLFNYETMLNNTHSVVLVVQRWKLAQPSAIPMDGDY